MTFIRMEPLSQFISVALTLGLMGLLAVTFLGGRWPWYALSDYVVRFFGLIGSMVGRPLMFQAERRKAALEAGGPAPGCHDLPRRSTLRLTCRGGFYVRSLARDLGRALGCGAHLTALRRTAIGPWMDPGEGREHLLTGADLLPWCPSRLLSDVEADHLAHGRAIPVGESRSPDWPMPAGFPDPCAPLRGLHDGHLVALLRPAEDGLRTIANLRGGL